MSQHRVLLTGTNGFIGSHILATLLQHGVSVRGVVRSRAKAEGVRADYPDAGSNLDFAVVPDMAAPNAFDEALVADPPFDVVIHTASPLVYSADKKLADFVEPAVRGTVEILEGVAIVAPGVKRVVITGSFAAIANPKIMQTCGKTYSADDWNPLSEDECASDPRLSYWVSKTLAEKAAWDFIKCRRPSFDIVVLNPPMVYGPLRHSIGTVEQLNVSNYNIWRDFLNSSAEAPLCKEWVHADVDVRDLAEAHYRAAFNLNSGNKRYLISRGRISNQEIADILRRCFPEASARIPRGKPGASSLGPGAFDVDIRSAQEDLQMSFRSHEETFRDLGLQLFKLQVGTTLE